MPFLTLSHIVAYTLTYTEGIAIIMTTKLQGRVKFPIGGKPRKPKWQNRVQLRWRQDSLDGRSIFFCVP